MTPCVKVLCVACKRTLQEIAQWGKMNNQDRNKIIKQLKERP